MKAKYDKIIKQVKLWDWSARIMPLLFFCVAALIIYVEPSKIKVLFFVGLSVFLLVSLVWWWWTIYTIARLSSVLKQAEENLDEVLIQIRLVKKDFIDDSNRKRGKQEGHTSQSN